MKISNIKILAVIMLISCSSKFNYEELNTFLADPDNGFVEEKNINGIRYQLQYKPTEQLVLQKLQNDSLRADSVFELVYNEYDDYYYFLLSVSKNNRNVLHMQSNQKDYSELFHQMAFSMADRVQLVTSASDSLPIVDAHYVRFFGLSDTDDFFFIFKRDQHPAAEYIFHLNEFGLGTGNTRFKFEGKLIRRKFKIQY